MPPGDPPAASTLSETPRGASNRRRPKDARPSPKVAVHAHRGGAALAPENSMEAFRNAVELGAPWVEFDVRRCGTGELLVVHDADLRRVGGSDLRIASASLAEAQSVDIGIRLGERFRGARVPTLVEVFETFRDRLRFNVEIKEDTARGDGTATGTAELIARMGLQGDVVVSSFNPLSLLRVKRAVDVPLGLVYPNDGRSVSDRLLRRPWCAPLLGAYALHPSHKVVTEAMVRKAHLRGLAVNTWTVNDEGRMRELIALRVNAIITDRPDLALALLDE